MGQRQSYYFLSLGDPFSYRESTMPIRPLCSPVRAVLHNNPFYLQRRRIEEFLLSFSFYLATGDGHTGNFQLKLQV